MIQQSTFLSLSKKLKGANIYLVGMMGSGKTKTGPKIANQLSYSFIDVDDVIQKILKKSISQIFDDSGESAFREVETDVLKEIGKRHSLVVATGGGLVTTAKNWGVLHQGIVVWIDPGRDRLLKRIEYDKSVRPLLDRPNPIKIFDDLLKKRNPIYSQADLHLLVEDESAEEVAFLIIEKLIDLINH